MIEGTPGPQGPGTGGDVPPRPELMDLRCFALVVAAAVVGVLLYMQPAVGLAVAGAITVLATLGHMVRR